MAWLIIKLVYVAEDLILIQYRGKRMGAYRRDYPDLGGGASSGFKKFNRANDLFSWKIVPELEKGIRRSAGDGFLYIDYTIMGLP